MVTFQKADGCGWLSAARKAVLFRLLPSASPSDFPAAWGILQLVWSRKEGQRAAEREGSRSPGKRWRSRGSRLVFGPPPAHSSLPTDIGGGGFWRQEQKRNTWSAAACSMEKHLRAEDAAWRPPSKAHFQAFAAASGCSAHGLLPRSCRPLVAACKYYSCSVGPASRYRGWAAPHILEVRGPWRAPKEDWHLAESEARPGWTRTGTWDSRCPTQ